MTIPLTACEAHVPEETEEASVFGRLVAIVRQSGLPCVVHNHEPTRTIDEAASNLDFDVTRIVKTIAFATRAGDVVLAALRGTRRVAYPQLAAMLDVGRRDLTALAPADVQTHLGVPPGSVSPVAYAPGTTVYVDEDVLAIAPTVYCGLGRPDRTLEIAPAHLVRLAGGRTGAFSK